MFCNTTNKVTNCEHCLNECKYLFNDECKELIKIGYERGRAEAIDEFAKALRSAIRDDTCGCSWDAKEIVARVAERLKGENV